MKTMTIARAAAVCGGTVSGRYDPAAELGRVVIDSRDILPGDFFVAYKGERVDGHEYIGAALDKGAVCCLAERVPAGEERAVLVVPDVQIALEQIAAAYRESLNIPIVGITGSVGKTSAKEMISAVLEQRYKVLKTDKNLNNQIGVPMTVSRITPEHEAAVIEMGISGFGEMTTLAKIVRPTIAVFTVIGHAHLEFLHDLDGVLRAKTEMLAEMDEDGTVIMNCDDEKLRSFACRQRKLSFGLSEGCSVRAENITEHSAERTTCDIVAGERRFAVTIPAFGRHMVYAALEGAAVGLALGLSEEEITRGIAAFVPVGRRAAVSRTPRLTLIDDCYNANPDSVKCGVDSLLQMPGRHVCILGDMLELGPDAEKLHREVGAYAAERGIDLVLCCGELSRHTAEGAGEIGRWFESREALIAALGGLIEQDDHVLVKASHSMHFELISEELKNLP